MKNIVEFGLNTRIHPVSIIFKDEATNDIRIHLGLKLYSTLSLALNHLSHFLLRLGRYTRSCGELSTDDVFLLTIERDIAVCHKLHHVFTVFTQYKLDETFC